MRTHDLLGRTYVTGDGHEFTVVGAAGEYARLLADGERRAQKVPERLLLRAIADGDVALVGPPKRSIMELFSAFRRSLR